MRDATWVVYEVPSKDESGPTRAVCAAADWGRFQAARPGLLTLVEEGIVSEGAAERLARGEAGDSPPRKGSPARKPTPYELGRAALQGSTGTA